MKTRKNKTVFIVMMIAALILSIVKPTISAQAESKGKIYFTDLDGCKKFSKKGKTLTVALDYPFEVYSLGYEGERIPNQSSKKTFTIDKKCKWQLTGQATGYEAVSQFLGPYEISSVC